jgi:hypothetical protein
MPIETLIIWVNRSHDRNYGSLQMHVRDGKRYGTGSVSYLSIDHETT